MSICKMIIPHSIMLPMLPFTDCMVFSGMQVFYPKVTAVIMDKHLHFSFIRPQDGPPEMKALHPGVL